MWDVKEKRDRIIVRSKAMKSFEAKVESRHALKDTKIPSGEIPFIILHWLHEHYYGGSLTPLDMRKFLESKLREGLYECDVVDLWVKRAHHWEKLVEHHHPGHVDTLLDQYFQIRVAA